MMITLARFKVEEILPHIGMGVPKLKLNTPKYGEFLVKASSTRLECFKRNQECVRCGLKGTMFHLESHIQKESRMGLNCFIDNCPYCALRRNRMVGMQTPHLNLYGFTKSGHKILMTQDHILPKHAGGPDKIENLQTMCQCCNSYKGGMLPGEYVETITNARERARYLRSMDGRSASGGRLPPLHPPTDNQAYAADCAAE